MGARLRGSGAGARWYGISIQLVFVGSIAFGLSNVGPAQSAVNRSLNPLAAAIAVCLCVLAIRTLFVGVYFAADRLIVRSWLRTYTVMLDSSPRCDTTEWSSLIVTQSQDSRIFRMLTISWTGGDRRRTRSFPVTVAGRLNSHGQAAVINAFIEAATSQPAPQLARDYARGRIRDTIVAEERAKHVPAVRAALTWLGLTRYPDAPSAEEPTRSSSPPPPTSD